MRNKKKSLLCKKSEISQQQSVPISHLTMMLPPLSSHSECQPRTQTIHSSLSLHAATSTPTPSAAVQSQTPRSAVPYLQCLPQGSIRSPSSTRSGPTHHPTLAPTPMLGNGCQYPLRRRICSVAGKCLLHVRCPHCCCCGTHQWGIER